MMKLAGGPDLMIYLSGLLQGGKVALRTDRVVAQFTASNLSITASGNRGMQLTIGYWLARVWAFQQAVSAGRRKLAGRLAGYLLAVWVFIMIKKLSKLDFAWMSELFTEWKDILLVILRERLLLRSLMAAAFSSFNRVRMVMGNRGQTRA